MTDGIPTQVITVAEMCSGKAGTGPALFDYWETHNCPLAYQVIMSWTKQGDNYIVKYSPTGTMVVQDYITQLFNNYQQYYLITDNVTDPRYNPFQETLLDLCLDPALPGACQATMEGGFCAATKRADLLGDTTRTNFCGCFVPSDPTVDAYVWGTSGCFDGLTECQRCEPNQPGCAIVKACDQLCHRSTSIQKADFNTGNLIGCPQDVCVINDVIIQAENSKLPGGINFTNVCSGCQGLGCYCVISGVNISETAASVGLAEDFNQFCGKQSVCMQQGKKVPCSDINTDKIPVKNTWSATSIAFVVFILVLTLIAVILLSLTSLAEKSGTNNYKSEQPSRKNNFQAARAN